MIIYSSNYKKENTKWLCIHHSGGLENNLLASTKMFIADIINKAHKERWNYKSSLGYFGGYNFFIDAWGNITQFRAIGEETMAQKGYNFNGEAISICLAGNFTKGVDVPSEQQKNALKELINELPKVAIVPHRKLGQTSCYGSGLSDTWASDLINIKNLEEQKKNILTKLIELYKLLILKIKGEK